MDEGDLQDHLPVRHKGDSLFLQKFIFYNENEDDNENDNGDENDNEEKTKCSNVANVGEKVRNTYENDKVFIS